MCSSALKKAAYRCTSFGGQELCSIDCCSLHLVLVSMLAVCSPYLISFYLHPSLFFFPFPSSLPSASSPLLSSPFYSVFLLFVYMWCVHVSVQACMPPVHMRRPERILCFPLCICLLYPRGRLSHWIGVSRVTSTWNCAWLLTWVLGIWTQVFLFAQWVLLPTEPSLQASMMFSVLVFCHLKKAVMSSSNSVISDCEF